MASPIEIGVVGEVDKEFDVTAPGVIEDLTRQGRMVHFQDGESGDRKDTLVFVPPHGVSFGDKAYSLYQSGYAFFSGRTYIGMSEMIVVDRNDGNKLRKRMEKTAKLIGRDKPYWYENVSLEEYQDLMKDRPERNLAGAEEWGF